MTSSAPAPMRVEVWSDVVCPWCYIGKRRLESALSQFDHADQVELVWRSFELDPTSPRAGEEGAGEDVATYLGRKYGGGRAAGLAMHKQVTDIAAGDGLEYHLDRSRRANTIDAHRLLHLALEEGGPQQQDALKERLLSAYFTRGEAVDDHETLTRLAVEAGLAKARVREVLAGSEFSADVDADVAQARAYGIGGVPFAVVDGRYGVSGAQPVDVFLQTLDAAWRDRTQALITVAAAHGVTDSPADDAAGATGATGGSAQVAADATDATGACGPDGCELPTP